MNKWKAEGSMEGGMEGALQLQRRRLECLGSRLSSSAETENLCDIRREVSRLIAAEVEELVPDAEVLISLMKMLKQILSQVTSSLSELAAPGLAELTSAILDIVQLVKDLLMPKQEHKSPLTEPAEKAAVELLEETLSAVAAVCNQLPQAIGEARASLITCASKAHEATLAFAKAALDCRSQLAPRLWKNVGEQLRCTAVDPALEPVLFDVPAIVLHLFDYSAALLENALRVWKRPDPSLQQAENEARNKRLTAPIRHGLLTVLRITATCPASVASQPCARELAAFVFLVTSLVSCGDSPLPTSVRSTLTKSVAEAIIAILSTLLESDGVPDASKCFLVRALCSDDALTTEKSSEREWSAGEGVKNGCTAGMGETQGAVALLRSCAETNDLGRLLCSGRLTSFSTLLSNSAKYSLAVKEELSRQLPQLSKLVPRSYSNLLSETPDSYAQLLQSLATFMVVLEASGSTAARIGIERFLLEGVLSGHPLMQQLVHDLWGFVFQLSEPSRKEAHLQLLMTVLTGLVVSETALASTDHASGDPPTFVEKRALRCGVSSTATLVNQLLRAVSAQQLETVYRQYISAAGKGLPETRICEALLRNAFPVELLPGALQKDLAGTLLSSVLKAAEGQVLRIGKGMATTEEEPLLQSRLEVLEAIVKDPFFERSGSPPLAQSAGQLALRIMTSQPKSETGMVNGTVNGTACSRIPAPHHAPALRLLIACHQHLPSDQLWAVLPAILASFRSAARSGPRVPPQLQPALADLLGALAGVAMPEPGPELQALVDLYHALLRERHWALAHVALASFSHFAAASPYTDLWRLVPTDAVAGRFEGRLAGDALSDSGQELDGFMRALQAFLERSVGDEFDPVGPAERAALLEDGKALADRSGETLTVRRANVPVVDLAEPMVEDTHGDRGTVHGDRGGGKAGAHENNENSDREGDAGMPEELQDACDDMERCVTELRKGLKRAAAKLTTDERGALRRKFGSLGQKLAGLVDQLFPD